MERTVNNLKSPKSVWFIMCNELCERFNYYGLRTVLVLYLTTVLNYSDDDSTIIYHGFIFLSYFMPFFGAIISDSYWGKFKTIIRLSTVYVIGNIILTGASMADNFSFDSQRFMTLIGLVLIAVGTGGIKPCCYTFGGDQFRLPEQQDQLNKFLNGFVIAIYIGSSISMAIIPEFRKLPCLGKDTCFPLAFGVLSLLMLTAIVVFVLGRKMYNKKKPENHVIFKTLGCIYDAARKKTYFKSSEKDHWLDNTGNEYSEIEISDTKAALEALSTYIAYPVFWALFEQQGSRWTLQATLMNGKIDGIGWEIKPDQIQSISPFFCLLLVLSFDSILFPLLAKVGIRKPLQKMVFSSSLAVVAFILTAILHYKIFGESTVIPVDQSQFTVYNGFDCNISVNSSSSMTNSSVLISRLESANFKCIAKPSKPSQTFDEDFITTVKFNFDRECGNSLNEMITDVWVARGKSISYILTTTVNEEVVLRPIYRYDDFTKPKNGHPSLRVVFGNDVTSNENLTLVMPLKKSPVKYKMSSFLNGRFQEVHLGNYSLMHGDNVISSNVNLKPATLYTLIIRRNGNYEMESKLYSTDEGNYLHILWQLPQYVFMITADVIFVSTTIGFSYTEAPPRIKSFMSACYSMTQSFGNLLVVAISAFSFHNQIHEYLFYSGLMLVDTLLLAYLSYGYKYKMFEQKFDDNEENDERIKQTSSR